MKIAATRDRAEVLLRNQEKFSYLSSSSIGENILHHND